MSDPSQCHRLANDIAMHWYPRGAKPGDRCHCGEKVMSDWAEEGDEA